MKALLVLSRAIDATTAFIGKQVAWLVLAAILVSAVNATVRKLFDTSSNAWLELQWYLYGAVFFLAAAYTLQRNEHVRIDFVSNLLSKRGRDWVDLFGHVFFLLPFAVLMFSLSLPWFIHSFAIGEMSPNAGGLIIWPAKLMIVLGFFLLSLQAVSEIIKRIAVIRGLIEEPYPGTDEPPNITELKSGTTIAEDEPR